MLRSIFCSISKTFSFCRIPTLVLGAISGIGIASPSFALSIFVPTANFDDVRPGAFQTSFSNGGITFSNLIAGRTIEPPSFIVQRGSRLLQPAFSVPNFLTFGVPGTFRGLGILGSVNIAPQGNLLSQGVSLDVVAPNPLFGSKPSDGLFPPIINQELVLEAFLEGKSVQRNSFSLSDFSKLGPRGRFVSGNVSLFDTVFDEVQLYASNFAADGVISLGIDNVRFFPPAVFDPSPLPEPILLSSVESSFTHVFTPSETVPESQPVTLLGLVGFGLVGYLSKKKA